MYNELNAKFVLTQNIKNVFALARMIKINFCLANASLSRGLLCIHFL